MVTPVPVNLSIYDTNQIMGYSMQLNFMALGMPDFINIVCI